MVALLQRLAKDPGQKMEQAVEESYNVTLKPWHGWISSAAFKVTSIPRFYVVSLFYSSWLISHNFGILRSLLILIMLLVRLDRINKQLVI